MELTNGRKISNGRVDIEYPRVEDQFQFYDKIPAKQVATIRDPTVGIWDENMISKIFFSAHNVDIIQNGIRAGIHKRSNGRFIIANQDLDTLSIIMRSIYLQNSINQPNNIKEQVEALNKIVFDYCIPQIYGECQGYRKYIEDASTMYTPIAHPVLTKNNDKELVLKPWF
jgi:hypothetical protein